MGLPLDALDTAAMGISILAYLERFIDMKPNNFRSSIGQVFDNPDEEFHKYSKNTIQWFSNLLREEKYYIIELTVNNGFKKA